MSDSIKIEITEAPNGGRWWAYIIQDGRRIIGRVFDTNPEAWQWAQAVVGRIRINKESPSDDHAYQGTDREGGAAAPRRPS